jgi:hypothetical protein
MHVHIMQICTWHAQKYISIGGFSLQVMSDVQCKKSKTGYYEERFSKEVKFTEVAKKRMCSSKSKKLASNKFESY